MLRYDVYEVFLNCDLHSLRLHKSLFRDNIRIWSFNVKLVLTIVGILSMICNVGIPITLNAAESETHTYIEDTSPFANPERGFYIEGRTQEQPPDDPDLWPGIDKWNVKYKRDTEFIRVVRQYYHLDLYKSQDIPQSYLDIMEDDLNFVREQGMKIIPRFTYSWDRASIPSGGLNDTNKEWTLRHIDTVMPVLAQHADIIAFVEMGFVGLWGEWWGSDNGWTTDPADYGACSSVQHYVDVFPNRQSDREEIINRVLEILPDNLKITLRYPRDKRATFRDNATGTDCLPLTASEAHTALRKARVGFHNDSVFKGDEDEQNTFFYCDDNNADFVQSQIDWQHQDALFVPQGGETPCPYDPVYGNCNNAMLRLAERRFDVLNGSWCPETIEAWKEGGCYDEIAAKLGYRIRLISAMITPTIVKPGSNFHLQIELINDGYGKIYNKRDFEVVLKHKASGTEHFIPVTDHDPRFWLPGEIQNMEIICGIPVAGVSEGDYDVFLFLPDPSHDLRSAHIVNQYGNPNIPYWSPYAIRLANQDVWEESTGYNDLLMDITVSNEYGNQNRATGQIMLKNWPNPFNVSTRLTYTVPNNNSVVLKIYDTIGREVQTLVKGYISSGEHSVNFNAATLPNGLYIANLQTGDKIKTRKMLLIR